MKREFPILFITCHRVAAQRLQRKKLKMAARWCNMLSGKAERAGYILLTDPVPATGSTW